MMCLKVVTGNWLVDGNPLLVLFDIGSAAWNLDNYKKELFEKSGVGIPQHDSESNDAVIFGFMAAQFIAEVAFPFFSIMPDLKFFICP